MFYYGYLIAKLKQLKRTLGVELKEYLKSYIEFLEDNDISSIQHSSIRFLPTESINWLKDQSRIYKLRLGVCHVKNVKYLVNQCLEI